MRFSVAILIALACGAQTKPDITGEWDGLLLGKLHLILNLEAASDGALKGNLQSPDQGAGSMKLDTVTFAAPAVHLELNSIKASFKGQLTADGAEIHGQWQQGGNSFPLILHRPGAALKLSLSATKKGSVDLQPCLAPDGNTQGLCGTYEVFENRDTKAGRKLAMHILLLPAASGKAESDPVFMLAGGPGQAAADAFVPAGFTAKLRAHRDILLVDQRGTGNSAQLACTLADPQDAQAVIATLFAPDAVKKCRDKLEAQADLMQYTTSIFADDLDEIRQGLGYGKIDLLGGSYGTRAALVYLRRHPDHVRAMVLSQVVPPGYKLGIDFAKPIQASLDHLFDDCAADSACAKAFPNVRAEYQTILERLEKAPAKFTFYNPTARKEQEITLPRGYFIANLRPILYIPYLAAALPSMLHKAFNNDWSSYARAVYLTNSGLQNSLARGLSLSVVCAEDVPFFSDADARRQTAGTDLGDFLVPVYREACANWPHATVPADFHAPVKSGIPVLMISGGQDPATPPSTAEEAARTLPNSTLLVIPQGTHLTNAPCLDSMIAQFVEQASAARLDTGCLATIKRPPFVTR